MSNFTKFVLPIAIVISVVIFALFASIISTRNSLVAMEQGIDYQYKQNQNIYDNYWKKVSETAQVASEYKKQLKEVFEASIKGRCGKDGCKAQWLMLKEQNPQLSPNLLQNVQITISSGRDEFKDGQELLLDKKRVYETTLKVFPNNLIAGFLGFPKIDLTKYDIITSESTDKAFKEKKSNELKVF